MIYFDAGGKHVGVTAASLFWFTVLTTIGTVLGGIAYAYLQAYLPALPDTSNTIVAKIKSGVATVQSAI